MSAAQSRPGGCLANGIRMKNALYNSLARTGDTLAVRSNPAKRRKTIHSNLFNTAVLLFFTVYAWMEHDTFLIVLNMVLCVPVLPLTIFVLYIELHAKPEESVIEIVPEGLRFLLAGASPITVRSEDLRELVLMPSAAGQTLMIVLEDEDAFRSRQSPVERFYMTMSRIIVVTGSALPRISPRRISGSSCKRSTALFPTASRLGKKRIARHCSPASSATRSTKRRCRCTFHHR